MASWLDCHIVLDGGEARGLSEGMATCGEALAELRRLRLGGALLTPGAEASRLPDANRRLCADAALFPELHVGWAVDGATETDPAATVAEAVRAGARALVLRDPGACAEASLFALLQALPAGELPLMVDCAAAPPEAIEGVAEALGGHSGVRAVLLAVPWDLLGRSDTLLRHPNLFYDTSALTARGAIGKAVDRFGPDRLLFGSGMPRAAGECAVEMIDRSGLATAMQALVVGGNARRLLHLVEPVPEAPLMRQAVIRPSGLVVDVAPRLDPAAPTPEAAAEALYLDMHRLGIHHAVLSGAGCPDEVEAANEALERAVDAYPKAFSACALAAPDTPRAHIDALLSRPGRLAVELDCAGHGLPCQDAAWDGAVAAAAGAGVPVVVHAHPENRLAERAGADASVGFVALLPSGESEAMADALSAAPEHGNVLFAITGPDSRRDEIAHLARRLGPRRLLMASGYPEVDLAHALGRYGRAALPFPARVVILGGGVLEWFRLGDIANELYYH